MWPITEEEEDGPEVGIVLQDMLQRKTEQKGAGAAGRVAISDYIVEIVIPIGLSVLLNLLLETQFCVYAGVCVCVFTLLAVLAIWEWLGVLDCLPACLAHFNEIIKRRVSVSRI